MKKIFQPIINIDGMEFERIPVKTRILMPGDSLTDIILEAAGNFLQPEDIISISESPLAITQGRAVPVSQLRISLLARILWRFVAKVPYGIGLRAPESMQCAIDECGAGRILLAAIVGGASKLIGRSGDFYRIAGMQAALIDAAHTSPVPPYDQCVIKGPLHPDKAAQVIHDALGYETAVMDINDIGGCWMIGGSKGINKTFMERVMKDNPQGQGDEMTPFCIIRKHVAGIA
jgi:hypothetical protein